MIERQTAYRVGEKVFSSLEEAQANELVTIASLTQGQADKLVAEAERVIAVLKMRPRSRALAHTPVPRKKRTPASPNPPASQ